MNREISVNEKKAIDWMNGIKVETYVEDFIKTGDKDILTAGLEKELIANGLNVKDLFGSPSVIAISGVSDNIITEEEIRDYIVNTKAYKSDMVVFNPYKVHFMAKTVSSEPNETGCTWFIGILYGEKFYAICPDKKKRK
jgi:hypothetical protein